MPRVSKRKSYQGRRYKPYAKRSGAGTVVTRQLNRDIPRQVPLMGGSNIGFPQQMKVRLKYVDEYVMTSTSGGTATQTFRMNSCFDPDYTGVGHQPYGFDQYAALFLKYTVLGSKLKCTWSPIGENDVTASKGPYNVVTFGDEDASVPGSILTSIEMPRSDHKVMGSKSGGQNVKTTSLTFSPARDLGLDPYDDTVGAVVSASPSQTYFGVCQCNDAGSTTSNVLLKVELEFLVLFKGSKNQAQS